VSIHNQRILSESKDSSWNHINLSFGLSSSDSEEFTQQVLEFSTEANGPKHIIKGPSARVKRAEDASKLSEAEGVKPKTQVIKIKPEQLETVALNILADSSNRNSLEERKEMKRSVSSNSSYSSDDEQDLSYFISNLTNTEEASGKLVFESDDVEISEINLRQTAQLFSDLWNCPIKKSFFEDVYHDTPAFVNYLINNECLSLGQDQIMEIRTRINQKDQFERLSVAVPYQFNPFNSEYSYMVKNRYSDALPYKENVPFECDDSAAKYVNASMLPCKFIVSQGPKEATLGDFWATIWEAKVSTIAMVTDLKENGRIKCDLYWPPLNFTWKSAIGVSIKTISEKIVLQTTIQKGFEEIQIVILMREFLFSKDDEKRTVHQFQLQGWQDHCDLPLDVFKELIQLINQREQKIDGKILVHCSAGLGRSGTLLITILAEKILAYAEAHKISITLNLDHLLIFLRMNPEYGRRGLVQTLNQYQMVQNYFKNRKGANYTLY